MYIFRKKFWGAHPILEDYDSDSSIPSVFVLTFIVLVLIHHWNQLTGISLTHTSKIHTNISDKGDICATWYRFEAIVWTICLELTSYVSYDDKIEEIRKIKELTEKQFCTELG